MRESDGRNGRTMKSDMSMAKDAVDPTLAKTTHHRIGVIALAENALGRLDQLAARCGSMRPLAQAFDQPQATCYFGAWCCRPCYDWSERRLHITRSL